MEEEGSLLEAVGIVVSLLFFALVCVGGYFGMQAYNQGIANTKASLKKRGYTLTEDGMQVKTEHRSSTVSEQTDAMNLGIRRLWKNTKFNVPPILAGTGLSGSKHDKNKDEWEQKHGPKKKYL
ncbi:hypothetical protein BT69DRAFT_1287402 [Atractiella rhizophila]|nr:hypothetical protein BT69DRAFT_1287402 [Atractiella rhizophila]